MTYTIKQTIAIIRHMGMTCKYRSEFNEFQVGGYFTEDRMDAIHTAAAMLNERDSVPQPSSREVARGRVISALSALNLRA